VDGGSMVHRWIISPYRDCDGEYQLVFSDAVQQCLGQIHVEVFMPPLIFLDFLSSHSFIGKERIRWPVERHGELRHEERHGELRHETAQPKAGGVAKTALLIAYSYQSYRITRDITWLSRWSEAKQLGKKLLSG
jgi:hypothetical protein